MSRGRWQACTRRVSGCPPASQVHATAESLRLITFDADGTLYADGAHFEQDNQMIAHIINLMRSSVQVRTWPRAAHAGPSTAREWRPARVLCACTCPVRPCRSALTVQVAIVTAAGYPGEAIKFERRLTGLLEAFRQLRLPPEITNR